MISAYAALLALACLWAWLRGDEPLVVWVDPGKMRPSLAALIGTGIGLAVVGASHLALWAFDWAKRLQCEFAQLLGSLSGWEVVGLALSSSVAEEAFFRGAMQPSLGWVLTSLLFGLLHLGPGRNFWPWTASATVMGFVLGGLAIWTGGLLSPILCHGWINLLNLWSIALTARRLEPDRR